jgi:NAD(P)-dependent dehydrogenase (short-subunit alcohol dehydrogenase family)
MDTRRALPLLAFGSGILLAYSLTGKRGYNLKDKNVLITGGSRGLGLALAREFAAVGARVTVCARDKAEIQRALHKLKDSGFAVDSVICDIAEPTAVTTAVREIEMRNGPIDVLVNNAGRIEVGPLEAATLQDFERAMATHFWGPLYLMRAVIPEMKRRGGGRIVNISSIGGKIGVPHLVSYAASKFALAGLSEGIAAEVRKDNIFVTTVYPGLMRTGSPKNASFKGQHRKEFTWFTLSDSLPLFTVAAARAARKIVNACRTGQASLTISMPAKLASLGHAIIPNTVISVLALANRLLPKAELESTRSRSGRDSQTPLTRSPLTILDELAANDLNQRGAG